MRQERTVQPSVFDIFAKREIGCELKKTSAWLDEHSAPIGLVAADLHYDGVQETGRHGLRQAVADGSFAQPRQPGPGEGVWSVGHGLPQEERAQDRGHG